MREGTLNNQHGCRKYVTIKEIDEEHDGKEIVICRGFKRQRHIFLSRGRKVKVVFYNDYSHFLLEYSGKHHTVEFYVKN